MKKTLLLTLILTVASSALAIPITYDFCGKVDTVDQQNRVPWLNVGNRFTGSLRIDEASLVPGRFEGLFDLDATLSISIHEFEFVGEISQLDHAPGFFAPYENQLWAQVPVVVKGNPHWSLALDEIVLRYGFQDSSLLSFEGPKELWVAAWSDTPFGFNANFQGIITKFEREGSEAVPDAGSTLAMLAFALAGLPLFRR